MKALVLSDTFPNRLEPDLGPYNAQQVEALARRAEVTVINPVSLGRLVRKPALARLLEGSDDTVVPAATVLHPLGLVWPWPAAALSGYTLALSARASRTCRQAVTQTTPDVIYSTWAFPHGHAAMLLARRWGCPYVIKCRGSDINTLPKSGLRRRFTVRALLHSDHVVPVSEDLRRKVADLGVPTTKVTTIYNGLDSQRFKILDREGARTRLGIAAARAILFVGSLRTVKGPDCLLEAFGRLRDGALASSAELYLVGSGDLEARLKRRVGALGLSSYVHFAGNRKHDDIPLWMNAADVLCLPSRNEGLPNVVREALACGTPVVASAVGGVPEVVRGPSGLLVPPDDPDALAEALRQALKTHWDRRAVQQTALGLDWDRNAEQLMSVLRRVTGRQVPQEGAARSVEARRTHTGV